MRPSGCAGDGNVCLEVGRFLSLSIPRAAALTWQRSRVTATEGEGVSCSPLCQKPRGLLKREQQPVPETFR